MPFALGFDLENNKHDNEIMDIETRARIVEEGGKVVGDLIKVIALRPRKPPEASTPPSKIAQTAPPKENMGNMSQEPARPPTLKSEMESHPKPPLAVKERKGLDPETMRWQLRQTRSDLWELEAHLKNRCLGCGGDLSCCFKHGLNLIDIASETKSMTSDSLWGDIINLGEEVKMKAHPENIKTGKYFNEFPELVLRTSGLRTRVDTKLIELEKPAPTLEEAKAEAAKLAEQEVEKLWQSQKKS